MGLLEFSGFSFSSYRWGRGFRVKVLVVEFFWGGVDYDILVLGLVLVSLGFLAGFCLLGKFLVGIYGC